MKYANPAPLGLTGFALATWLLSMVNAGWWPATGMPMVLAMAFAFGGTAQFVAGVCELPRGNTFGFVAFCSFGAFWWSFALFMWAATFSASRAVGTVFFLLWVICFLLALGEWTGSVAAHTIGGYTGLLTASAAFYLAAAEVLSETVGRDVLPVGRLGPAPGAPHVAEIAGRT